MRRVLLRIAAALGVTAAAAFALFFGLPQGSKPSDFDVRKTRAPAIVILEDGGSPPNCVGGYCTVGVPAACPRDGGDCQLPPELVASCLASVRFGTMPAALADDCLRGDAGVAPSVTVRWVGGNHDTPDPGCTDDEVCDGGAGIKLEADQCAARGWPAAGPCLLPDGGPAPYGVTLAPGTWSGAGCVPRVCVVFAHGGSGVDPGWPDSAPLQLEDGGLVAPRGGP